MRNMDAKKKTFIMQLDENLSKMERPILTLDEMILLLLYAQKDKPIITRTLFFKELFLFYEEILKKLVDTKKMADPNFIPYKYGPFSFTLSEVLASLVIGGLIKHSGRAKGRDEEFKLTDAGVMMAENIVENLPPRLRKDLMEELSNKRIGWDQLGKDGILKYVYKKYKKYTVKSEIRNRYRDVRWGTLFEE